MAKRVQLSRAKGWRMPSDTVKVDRTTPLGNPFRVGVDGTQERCVELHAALLCGLICLSCKASLESQEAHRRAVMEARTTHKGKNLGCWCRMGTPCHVDNLLKVFNGR
ncbi:MAG: DUF4326 domain-containing protein [Betaproteobacteria bacterium]|nr:DUF4326 domain-containing protein [Betaproteobacteria bacterium]